MAPALLHKMHRKREKRRGKRGLLRKGRDI